MMLKDRLVEAYFDSCRPPVVLMTFLTCSWQCAMVINKDRTHLITSSPTSRPKWKNFFWYYSFNYIKAKTSCNMYMYKPTLFCARKHCLNHISFLINISSHALTRHKMPFVIVQSYQVNIPPLAYKHQSRIYVYKITYTDSLKKIINTIFNFFF